MKQRNFLIVFILMFLSMGITNTFATAKRQKTNIKLIEAYTETSAPKDGSKAKTITQLVVIWQGADYPETFFWRGNNGWLTCKTDKAHRVSAKAASKKNVYVTDAVDNNNIHKGDTLLLTPVSGGKFPVPAEIPESAKNTLYYKTAGSGWLALPVKKIAKR